MIETVLRCHATDKRQPIHDPEALPNGWVSIPMLAVGSSEPSGPRELEDLHFSSYEVLAEWASSQAVLSRQPPRAIGLRRSVA
jgi:hypothetical protein